MRLKSVNRPNRHTIDHFQRGVFLGALVTGDHSQSANLREGQNFTWGSFVHENETYGIPLWAAAAANINFTAGAVFHGGNISSAGLTLKRAPKSSRITPLDRTHATSY